MKTFSVIGAGVGSALVLALAVPASGAFIDDFESDTVGQEPSRPDIISSGEDRRVEVIDSGSTPFADPFAESGNQSVVMETNTNTSRSQIVYNTGELLTNGEFSLQLYLFNDGEEWDRPWVRLSAGQDTTGNNRPVGSDSVLDVFIDNGSVAVNDLNNVVGSVPTNEVLDVVFDFNADDQTFGMTVNGDSITDNGNDRFDFDNTLPGIEDLGIEAGFNSLTGSRIAVDDVTLIPEPGTTALLGLGGLMLLSRRRR